MIDPDLGFPLALLDEAVAIIDFDMTLLPGSLVFAPFEVRGDEVLAAVETLEAVVPLLGFGDPGPLLLTGIDLEEVLVADLPLDEESNPDPRPRPELVGGCLATLDIFASGSAANHLRQNH